MSQLQSGHELCDKCGKPYIAALNGVSCSCVKVDPVKKKVSTYTELKESNKAMYEALETAIALIKHIGCPDCNGSGVVIVDGGENGLDQEQCRICYETDLMKQALAKASPDATDRKIEELVGDGS